MISVIGAIAQAITGRTQLPQHTCLFYRKEGYSVGSVDIDLILNSCKGAELRLNHDAVIVRILYNLSGEGDILLKRLGGSIDHNRSKATVNAGFAKLKRIAVIQVECDRKTGVDDGSFNKLHQIGVIGILAGTLGNLKNQRRIQFLRRFRNSLHDLHIIDVECANCISTVIGFLEHFNRSYQRHIFNSPLKKFQNLYKKHIYKFVFILYPQIIP